MRLEVAIAARDRALDLVETAKSARRVAIDGHIGTRVLVADLVPEIESARAESALCDPANQRSA